MSWVEEKEKLKNQEPEELIFIGEPGAAGVIDGKLPSGEDYEWSKQQLEQFQLQEKVSTVWFSPAFAVEKGAVALPALARDLAQWILEDHLPVRFQLQLHKLLWNDESGR